MNPISFLVHLIMLPILTQSYALTGNYGWAIICLTVVIRVVLMPLTAKSYYSSRDMQLLQPKLKALQDQYKDHPNPEEMNKAMVELFKGQRVNPLGGCLPLLIQMPFLIALYSSLTGAEFKAMLAAPNVQRSFLVLPDLTHLGVFHQGAFYPENLGLLALFTLTTVLQQRVMLPPPAPGTDPRQLAMQKQMQVMMPIIITVMFLSFPLPTGVFLYLLVSNLIGIAQYAWLKAQSDRREAVSEKMPNRAD